MDLHRRRLLRTAGGTLAGGTVLGATASTTSAAEDPADEWDPAHYSNYSDGNRGADDINWIVIHTTAGSYSGAVSWFKDYRADVSAHYVIRNEDGYATKMVAHENVAWHASGFNAESIGIEHEWYDGQGPVSRAAQEKSAEIVRYLANLYDIPLELRGPEGPCNYDGGIIRHTDAPTDAYCQSSNQTSCPEGFDFQRYMSILNGSGGGGGGGTFEMDQTVHATADVWVRRQPGLDAEKVTIMTAGSTGTVVNGPQDEDGYTWWGVHYPNGGDDIWAWTPEEFLAAGEGSGGGSRPPRVTERNVEALGKLLTSEAGRYVATDAERRAVGYTVINRMDRQGTDDVRDVWDAYAHGRSATDASRSLARSILEGSAADPTQGAIYFYSPRSMPTEGESTDGYDVSGGLEWVPGLDRPHYRPGWGRDNEQVYIEGVRPAYYKFFTRASAPSKPDCAGDICLGDAVVADGAGATAFTKPRGFAGSNAVSGDTAGTVVGDGITDHGGTTYAKVHFDDGTTGYVPVGQLDPAGSFDMGEAVETTTAVWVRRRPGFDGEKVTVMSGGADGEVINGPVDEDGYTWWGIHFPNGGDDVWAWTPGEFLRRR